jgi:GNAT superfamily N-acetyltransferase
MLRFTSVAGFQPGLIAGLLTRSYAAELSADPQLWQAEAGKWQEYDREVFGHPDSVGAFVFLSHLGDELVGFGSFDPRQGPALGIVGHNCILPEYRGRGLGGEQLGEILRRLRERGIRRTKASTLAGDANLPARKMYLAAGFREVGRRPWAADQSKTVVDFEKDLIEASRSGHEKR